MTDEYVLCLTEHCSHITEITQPNFIDFFSILPMAVSRSSSDAVVNCDTLCILGAVGDVMFSRNGLYRILCRCS